MTSGAPSHVPGPPGPPLPALVRGSGRAAVATVRRRWLLAGVIAVGALVRFWGLEWHLPATLHSDEHNIVNAALRFGTGDLNPHYFVYGSLLMYLAFAGYAGYFALGWLGGAFASSEAFAVQYFLDPTWFYLIPRAIVAAAGCVTVALVVVLGRRLHSRAAGLLGALFLALHADHVRESHFALPAVLGACFATGAIALMLARRRELGTRPRWAFAVGVVAGLGVSAHVLAVLGPVLLGPWIYLQTRAMGHRPLRVLVAAGLGTLAGAFAGEPFLFLDARTALPQILVWPGTLVGGTFLAATAWWLRDLWTALGPLGVGLVGVGVAAAARHDRPGTMLLVAAVLGYLTFLGLRGFAPPRYVLQVTPIVCAFAGVGAATLVTGPVRPALRTGVILLLAAAVGFPAWRAWSVAHAFGLPDTRVLARQWIHAHVPPGARLLVDGADAELPRLVETSARAAELETRVRTAAGDTPARYRGLATYYRVLGLAAERTTEPTYWILRLKHAWWAVTDGNEEAGVDFAIVPPTTELNARPLEEYRRELGIGWVVTTSVSLGAYDKDLYPRAQRLYRSLRAEGRLVHVEAPRAEVSGPTVYVWRVDAP